MFYYIAYGLHIQSTLPLPDLPVGGTERDVIIRQRQIDPLLLKAANKGECFLADSEQICLFWEGVGRFMVRGGREIEIDPDRAVDERVLSLFILGPVMAALLLQRGTLVLHASSVAIKDGAIAFLGGAGWGKSTLAAFFYSRGYSVVADDIAVVHVDGFNPEIASGFPQLKLWPRAAFFLGKKTDGLQQQYSLNNKHVYRATQGSLKALLPLKRIYILAEGAVNEIVPLRPQEAMIELIRHTYAIRLLEATGVAHDHFMRCARISKQVPACILKRQHALSALDELVQMIEEETVLV